MAKIHVIYNDTAARSMKKRLEAAMKGSGQDQVFKKVAFIYRDRLMRRTPKRWTGQVRRQWQVTNPRKHFWQLTNEPVDPSKPNVMKFLEMGTKAHGPKKAKMLFIPLTRRAAQAGAKGVMRALKAWRNGGSETTTTTGKKKKPPFVMFTDFLFKKNVAGIRALWIVRTARPQSLVTLRLEMQRYIKQFLK